MTNFKDMLSDVLKYTNIDSLGPIKLDVDDKKKLTITTANETNTFILYGNMDGECEDLVGVAGISYPSRLRGYMNLKVYQGEGAKIQVSTKTKGEEEFPFELTLEKDFSKITYRFMHQSMLPRVPVFRGANWDLEFTPDSEAVKEFIQTAGILDDVEAYCSFEVKDENVILYIGDKNASAFKAQMCFKKDVGEARLDDYLWPIKEFKQVLNLPADSFMIRFSNEGVMNVSATSKMGTYNFYIIPNQR
jgi:hypothetical protein